MSSPRTPEARAACLEKRRHSTRPATVAEIGAMLHEAGRRARYLSPTASREARDIIHLAFLVCWMFDDLKRLDDSDEEKAVAMQWVREVTASCHTIGNTLRAVCRNDNLARAAIGRAMEKAATQ